MGVWQQGSRRRMLLGITRTFGHEQDVIKQVVGLWGGLQQRHQHCCLPQVAEVPQGACDLKGGAAVQSCADLIQKQGFLGPYQQLPCKPKVDR